jgi:hypothetical protein
LTASVDSSVRVGVRIAVFSEFFPDQAMIPRAMLSRGKKRVRFSKRVLGSQESSTFAGLPRHLLRNFGVGRAAV